MVERVRQTRLLQTTMKLRERTGRMATDIVLCAAQLQPAPYINWLGTGAWSLLLLIFEQPRRYLAQ